MTTRTLGFGLLTAGLLVSLSACKDGNDCDTAAGEVCDTGSEGDADADSDSDSDTDSDADADFDDYAAAFSFYSGYQDGAHVNWTASDGSVGEPWVSVTIYEEAYFDDGDDRYSCTWNAYITEVATDNLGVDGLWYGAEMAFEGVEGGTDCANFNEEAWGSTDPTAAFEAMRWGLGWGPLGPNVGPSLEEAVNGSSYDWATDFEPYVFSYYLGFTSDTSMTFADSETVSDYGYAFAYEVDPSDMSMVFDSDEAAIQLELGSATEMPSAAFLQGAGWYLPYTSNFTGE
ncbi:MAG: hypothetical protein VX899_12605 [Myxococcota bacterium]|nr:hypothetical protein [Myxococcota bacterium]